MQSEDGVINAILALPRFAGLSSAHLLVLQEQVDKGDTLDRILERVERCLEDLHKDNPHDIYDAYLTGTYLRSIWKVAAEKHPGLRRNFRRTGNIRVLLAFLCGYIGMPYANFARLYEAVRDREERSPEAVDKLLREVKRTGDAAELELVPDGGSERLVGVTFH